MFTGLVQCVGSVRSIRAEPPGKRITIHAPLEGAAIGRYLWILYGLLRGRTPGEADPTKITSAL